MSNELGPRIAGMRGVCAARSRGPSGDATAARDAGAAYAVTGIRSAARSRFADPSGYAPRRPANVAGRRRYSVVVLFGLTEATGMSRGRRLGVEVFSGLSEVST